jgi:hypothetical protein
MIIVVPSCLTDAEGARTRSDYSGTIVSERRRWRTHTLGPILKQLSRQNKPMGLLRQRRFLKKQDWPNY